MNKPTVAFSASLAIVCFILGVTLGFAISPSYQQNMLQSKESMDLGVADRRVDLRYINAMAAHHRGAILLAEQAAQTTARPEIQALTKEIQANEPTLIAELYGWKKTWYSDNRRAQDPQVANLGGADDASDLRFLNALIAHHEAGILMAQEIRAKSSRTEILNNADAVEQFLTGSLVTLKEWRKNWYNVT